jgi:hypothetical protein
VSIISSANRTTAASLIFSRRANLRIIAMCFRYMRKQTNTAFSLLTLKVYHMHINVLEAAVDSRLCYTFGMIHLSRSSN